MPEEVVEAAVPAAFRFRQAVATTASTDKTAPQFEVSLKMREVPP